MKGYTPFGKIIRKEMIDNNENLMDLAKILGVSTAFVSSVLTGNKSIPDGWYEILANHYEMNLEKRNQLQDAYCKSKNNIKIDMTNINQTQRRLAVQFQRKLNSLNEDEMKSLFEILEEGDN